ncbi:hypothetical protein Hanom_Chr11g00985971 [Helianthus anomalus]
MVRRFSLLTRIEGFDRYDHPVHRVAKLEIFYGGSKTYIPKNFYRTGGSKTCIPKNFYMKTTYITLLAEKFGGSGAPPGPFKASPLLGWRLPRKSPILN